MLTEYHCQPIPLQSLNVALVLAWLKSVEGSLAQFLAVDWFSETREQGYAMLLSACQPESGVAPEDQAARDRLVAKILSLGHTASVQSVSWSPDGRSALSGSLDKTVRLWEVQTGRCERVLEGHTGPVNSVSWNQIKCRCMATDAADLQQVIAAWALLPAPFRGTISASAASP